MKTLLSWSSGKDSAWALEVLRRRGEHDVIGLVTTFNEAFDRVAMHGVRRTLVAQQAAAAGVPLWSVPIPWPCSNGEYERRMSQLVADARGRGVTHFAFGDLFLEDIRAYRIGMLAGSGIEPVFPLWCSPQATRALARTMVAAGMAAVLTCIDPKQIPSSFIGHRFDERLLNELPSEVDPCGERGEFHTFCFRGPMFSHEIPITAGAIVGRDGFWFVDLT